MSEVWIVQPYVPSYRVPFFERLNSSLGRSGITLRVVAGRPDSVQVRRGDATAPSWLVQANDHVIHAFGRSVTLTRTRRYWRTADAVIVPHMGSSLDAFSALWRKSGLKVGVWGHIASYTSKPNRVDQAIERWQLRRADQVFAYTRGGADFAVRNGAEPRRVTTVMNSIDTDELRLNIAKLDREVLAHFRTRHRLPQRNLFAYIGGLDVSKRIEFLAETLELLFVLDPTVHLAVAGAGQDGHLLDAAVERGQATLVGYVQGLEKAALLKSSIALLNPGRVGLLAVDALAAGRPVVTTDWPFHAPEMEYLERNQSVYIAADNPRACADVVATLAATSGEAPATPPGWDYPTLDDMVASFDDGVRMMLERSR